MTDAVDGAIVTLAQLLQVLDLVQGNAETAATGEIYALAMDDGFAGEFQRSGLGIDVVGELVEERRRWERCRGWARYGRRGAGDGPIGQVGLGRGRTGRVQGHAGTGR